ncbi:MAG: transglutaminase family protein [Polyangiaceae bacterium]
MRLRVVHATDYEYEQPLTTSYHELRVTPRDGETQIRVAHRVEITPAPNALTVRTDFFGNCTHYFSLHQPHRSLRIVATSEVELEGRRQLPLAAPSRGWEEVRGRIASERKPEVLDAYSFTFDSSYVRAATSLREYALPSFPPARPLMEAARDLTRRIHQEFTYDPSATQISTPLAEVLRKRRGVCQDFAHLQIGCLRSLGLPGRYVSGYMMTKPPPGRPRLVGADASHAWASTFCPDVGWVDFDPANDVIPSDGHVTMAYGRDFGDVTPVRGVIHGGGRHAMRVSVDVAGAQDR